MARRTLAQVEQELTTARQQRQETLSAALAAHSELEQFKEKVREVALDVKKEQGWCDSGFNDVMNELGLDPLPSSIVVEVEVTATQIISVELTPDVLEEMTEEEAREHVQSGNLDFSDYLQTYNWEFNDVVNDDIKSVEFLTD